MNPFESANRRSLPSRRPAVAAAATLVASLLSPHAAAQGPLTPGNLVTVRVGDGVMALTAAAAPVFLDEYTPGGTLVQSIGLPTTAAGGQFACTQSGTSTIEGAITQSVDGQYLIVAGYDAPVGTPNVAATASSAVRRVIARIGLDGSVDTSTGLTDAFSGGALVSAASPDGLEFWMAGSTTGPAAATGGVRYAALGASTSVQVCNTVPEPRFVGISGRSLRVSSRSASSPGVYRVGNQLSSQPGQIAQLSAGGPGYYLAQAGGGGWGGNPPPPPPPPGNECNPVPTGCDSWTHVNEIARTVSNVVECPPNPPVVCSTRFFWPTGDPWWFDRDNEFYPRQPGSTNRDGIDRGTAGGPPVSWVVHPGVDFRSIREVYQPSITFSLGGGCAGSAGVPTLAGTSLPHIGRPLSFQIGNLPLDLAIVAIGTPLPVAFDLGILGAPGCPLHTTLDLSAFVIGAGSVANYSLQIPSAPVFLGLSFAAQAASLDPFANALGMTTTNAVVSTIGW